MTNKEVLNRINESISDSGIVEVICDVLGSSRVYSDASILIFTEREDWDGNIDDDQVIPVKHWHICKSIDNFKEIYLSDDKFLHDFHGKVIEFKDVRAFVSDFKK